MPSGPTEKETLLETLLPMWEDPVLVGAFTEWHPAATVFYQSATDALLGEAAIQPGIRVLDIGTGTGIPALFLAERVGPHGVVVATDPSLSMLAVAEANAHHAGIANLTFQRAVAEALPFPDQHFDAVVSQLGLMFVADLARALQETRRVLRPSGRAAFLAWGPYDQNPFWAVFHDLVDLNKPAALSQSDGEAAPPSVEATAPDPRHPFRFAEGGLLADALHQAGFADVREERRQVVMTLPSVEPILRLWTTASSAYNDLPAAQSQQVLGEARAAYARFADGDGVAIPASIVLGSGAA